jgi:hypothetical protein
MLAAAVALFVALSLALALSHRGLQYDEALMVLGSVQLRNSPEILPLPQDPHTWACLAGRCFPLMTVRYVGALKEYLTAPAMVLFGSSAAVVRTVSVLWACLGVYGIGRMFGPVAALVLAISPSLAGHAAFDNGAVAGWLGAMGLACVAIARYREGGGSSKWSAFWMGAAVGLGVWSRANFLWLVAAAAVGWAPTLVGWVRERPRHAVLAAVGAAVGAAPFLAYQALSGLGTFEAVGMFAAAGPWGELLADRASMWSRSLLCGVEMRSMWGGEETPAWQHSLLALVVLASLVACLWVRDKRGLGVTLAVVNAFLFLSRLPVAEHHFVPTLPIAAAVVASAGSLAPRAAMAIGLVYAALCASWHYQANTRLRATGGVGQWSDAIVDVQRQLEKDGRPVRILDWGFQNSLFVLSDTRIKLREEQGSSWSEAIARGGLFLLPAGHGVFFPETYAAFHRDLALSGRATSPTVFRERSGRVFAELWDIPPGAPEPPPPVWLSKVSAADPAHARQFHSLHQIEQGAWRWSGRRFSIILANPGGGGEFELDLHIPAVAIQRLGTIGLTPFVDGRRLDTATYFSPGDQKLALAIQSDANPVVVHISLDRHLAGTAADPRDLGVIVKSAELHR